jgi:hypothetical protein
MPTASQTTAQITSQPVLTPTPTPKANPKPVPVAAHKSLAELAVAHNTNRERKPAAPLQKDKLTRTAPPKSSQWQALEAWDVESVASVGSEEDSPAHRFQTVVKIALRLSSLQFPEPAALVAQRCLEEGGTFQGSEVVTVKARNVLAHSAVLQCEALLQEARGALEAHRLPRVAVARHKAWAAFKLADLSAVTVNGQLSDSLFTTAYTTPDLLARLCRHRDRSDALRGRAAELLERVGTSSDAQQAAEEAEVGGPGEQEAEGREDEAMPFAAGAAEAAVRQAARVVAAVEVQAGADAVVRREREVCFIFCSSSTLVALFVNYICAYRTPLLHPLFTYFTISSDS